MATNTRGREKTSFFGEGSVGVAGRDFHPGDQGMACFRVCREFGIDFGSGGKLDLPRGG